jgi:CheY-like chemotaxis protein
MSDDLLTARALVVSESKSDQELFRKAAALSSIPIEIVSADDAAAACRKLSEGADLVFLDRALGNARTGRIVSAARAARKPSFTVVLTHGQTGVDEFLTDALATKPGNVEEARRLLERSTRVHTPVHALVVDDSSTMRSIVRKILTATRFPVEVSEAADGAAALKLVADVDFDLVFLDYNMPGFSGLETLSELTRERRAMSIVVMTSMSDVAFVGRVYAHGATFLKKPFFPADIEAVLARHYGLVALNPGRAK